MKRSLTLLLVLASFLTSTAFAGEVEDANVESCKKFYATLNHGDMDAMVGMMAEDFVEHEVFPGLTADREGVKQFFGMMRAAFPDLKMEPEFFVAQGDKVVAYLTMSGTHKGEFMGMAPTGKTFSMKTVDIIRIENGKAVEHWGVSDAMSMMEQLGMMNSGEMDMGK